MLEAFLQKLIILYTQQRDVLIAVMSITYNWSTIEAARHSVRVICDEEGLTVKQKNDLCATIGGESGWQSYYLTGPKKGQPVIRENMRNGKLWSTDRGICQWNDYYHSKEISPEDAQNNNEKAVRLMCRYAKKGQLKQWVAYSSGAYLKYLNVKVVGNTIT